MLPASWPYLPEPIRLTPAPASENAAFAMMQGDSAGSARSTVLRHFPQADEHLRRPRGSAGLAVDAAQALHTLRHIIRNLLAYQALSTGEMMFKN